MNLRLRILLAGIPLLLSACALPTIPLGSGPPPSIAPISAIPLVTVPPDATPTATPFQPLPTPNATQQALITPTPTGPACVIREEFPGPTESGYGDIPSPACTLEQPPGQVNILLLGSDQRPNSGGFRTDTILLVTINPKERTANLTSFPRDLYVYIPGWTVQRINTAHAHGGFPMTQDTFEYNFGVRPDNFVMINFWGFEQLINSLGGINVNIASPHCDHRHGYGNYCVPAGVVRMDGETALWYARSRYSTSDFDRTRRQQEVILGIFYRLLSLDAITRAPELYEIYKDSVTTDLTLADVTPLLPLATVIGDEERINRYAIGRGEVNSWTTPGGAAVLLPIPEAVMEVMKQAVNSP